MGPITADETSEKHDNPPRCNTSAPGQKQRQTTDGDKPRKPSPRTCATIRFSMPLEDVSLFGVMASTSSMNTMQGAFSIAARNSSRTCAQTYDRVKTRRDMHLPAVAGLSHREREKQMARLVLMPSVRRCCSYRCPFPQREPQEMATAAPNMVCHTSIVWTHYPNPPPITFCSDSPDMPLTISGADILRKATSSSPAMAFAKSVLPQPGGPCKRIPLGCSTDTSMKVTKDWKTTKRQHE